MNKYILDDMITPMLKKEMNMVDYPLPEELRVWEGEHPTRGKVSNRPTRYKADKIKRVSVLRHDMGGAFVGSVIMIVGEDEYDFPFVVGDVSFIAGEDGKDKLFTEFMVKPLVKDEESMTKYVDSLRGWREVIGKIPAEPVTGYGEAAEVINAKLLPMEWLYFVPIEYLDQVLASAKQFFEIALDFWRKAEPVKDAERIKKMKAWRAEYNYHLLEEDPSGISSVEMYGRERTELYFNHLVYV